MIVQKELLFYLSFDLDHVFNIICFQYTYGVGPTSGLTLGQILTCTWEGKKQYKNNIKTRVVILDCYVWLFFHTDQWKACRASSGYPK